MLTSPLPRVPYDIIYQIYLYVDDYVTASHFLLLSRGFTKAYMMYNYPFQHRFNILFKNLFTFLYLLPDNLCDMGSSDIDFYELVSTQCLRSNDKCMLKRDIRFMYNIYKQFLSYYLASDIFNTSISKRLAHFIMLQGPDFINNIIIVDFRGSCITLRPYHITKNNTLHYIKMYYADQRHICKSLLLLKYIQLAYEQHPEV